LYVYFVLKQYIFYFMEFFAYKRVMLIFTLLLWWYKPNPLIKLPLIPSYYLSKYDDTTDDSRKR
jgi:hypothetical protein